MKKIILLILCLFIFNVFVDARVLYQYKGNKNSIVKNYKLKEISNIGIFKESFYIEGYLLDIDEQPIKNKDIYIYSALKEYEEGSTIIKTNAKGKFKGKFSIKKKLNSTPNPKLNITFVPMEQYESLLYLQKRGEDIKEKIYNPIGLFFFDSNKSESVDIKILSNKGEKIKTTELTSNNIILKTIKLSGKYFRQQKENALLEVKNKLKENNINNVNVEATILYSDEILKDNWQDIIETIIETKKILLDTKKKFRENNIKRVTEVIILNFDGTLRNNWQDIVNALISMATRLKKIGIKNIDGEKIVFNNGEFNRNWEYDLEQEINIEAFRQARTKLKNKETIYGAEYEDYDIEKIICEQDKVFCGGYKIRKIKDNWKQLLNKEIQKAKQRQWQAKNEIKRWKNSAHVVEQYLYRCPNCFRYTLNYRLLMKTGDRYHSWAIWVCLECKYYKEQLNGF